jgi:hypothetical protein
MHEESQDKKTLWVPMLEPKIVKQIRALAALKWGTKRIAAELGIARNSVRRYLREGAAAKTQTRPGAWTLDADQQATVRSLLDGPAAGNGVVVKRLLAEQEVEVPLRTLQRVLAPHRQAQRAAMWTCAACGIAGRARSHALAMRSLRNTCASRAR